MKDARSNHQDLVDTTVTPLRGIMIMAGSILALIIAVALPFGEALFAGLQSKYLIKQIMGKK
ncbi:hypothetical protein [Spirosoma endbachense]|uniref:hypothetical protein n=1 Tax=Spirosoma endbachense TaxID=2666025 RepID=UPI001E42734D|nr:hypothetical protein [Spirosoma endbachense]